jgi:hypothetical protein
MFTVDMKVEVGIPHTVGGCGLPLLPRNLPRKRLRKLKTNIEC